MGGACFRAEKGILSRPGVLLLTFLSERRMSMGVMGFSKPSVYLWSGVESGEKADEFSERVHHLFQCESIYHAAGARR